MGGGPTPLFLALGGRVRPDVVETGRYSEVRAGAVIGLWGFCTRCCRTRRGVRALSSASAAATT